MSDTGKVNSNPYWDHRFGTDWESAGGREQSRFFSDVAIAAMPRWLVDLVHSNKLTVCDWGCAEGDGTQALAKALDWDITGIDFSATAIERARELYGDVKFSHENLLDAPNRPAFDVVFSSNTLEHFSDPWGVFEKVAAYASKYLVLLVPYREYERHEEHEFTFDSGNVPVSPNGKWVLVHSAVQDTSDKQPCYWQGEQILLVYARTSEPVAQQLMLGDAVRLAVEPEADAHAPLWRLQQEVNEGRRAIDELTARATAAEENVARMESTARAQSERIHFLEYREKALMTEIQTLLATTSWRVTAPLRALRASPRWARQRLQDVRYTYAHGGIRSVASKSLAYLPRRLERAQVACAETVHADHQVVIRPPRERRALPDVFLFGIIDWHFRIQRPQHLAREFARAGHRVYYFSNQFEDSSEPGFSVERLDDGLALYQVKLKVRGAPAIYFAAPTQEAIEQISEGIKRFREWSGTDRSYAIVQHAYWYPVAARVQSQCMTYDCMDHHEGFGNVPQALLDLEERVMKRADLLIATSTWLEEHAHKYNANVAVIRNAGQYSDFCNAPAERYVDARGRKIIGYYGAIAEWFDVELIAAVARAFPDALVLLVGADTANVGARLREFDNVEMTGEVPYARLPYYLYAFDICMLPFRVIPLTLATNPVKAYEYLAAGRSVVSIDLPEMAQFGDLVRLADSHDGFIEQVKVALTAQPDAQEVVDRRKAFAAGQTWAHRVASFREAITALPRPKVSAIVLTYNNLALTKNCLEGLEAGSDDVDLEIIIVDNASSDGSPEFLTAWASSRSNVKLILNDDNRGFAAGNNQGLAVATGDYLVILNNDTVVTRGWAWRLVNHLRNNPQIGIVGPLTNNIGNEARVKTHYSTPAEMHVEAECITEANLGRWFELDTVAFFCAMLPRSTYETCGPLCEDYGVGFFEDDDYCRQVQKAGLTVACAEDAFVHHHLSASFDKLGAERKRALFEANRLIYEAKWGKWVPHQYRSKSRG